MSYPYAASPNPTGAPLILIATRPGSPQAYALRDALNALGWGVMIGENATIASYVAAATACVALLAPDPGDTGAVDALLQSQPRILIPVATTLTPLPSANWASGLLLLESDPRLTANQIVMVINQIQQPQQSMYAPQPPAYPPSAPAPNYGAPPATPTPSQAYPPSGYPQSGYAQQPYQPSAPAYAPSAPVYPPSAPMYQPSTPYYGASPTGTPYLAPVATPNNNLARTLLIIGAVLVVIIGGYFLFSPKITGTWVGTFDIPAQSGFTGSHGFVYMDIQSDSGNSLSGSSKLCVEGSTSPSLTLTGSTSGYSSAHIVLSGATGDPLVMNGDYGGSNLNLSGSISDSSSNQSISVNMSLHHGAISDFNSSCGS